MNQRIFTLFLSVAVSSLALLGCDRSGSERVTLPNNTLARFATDFFFAGATADLKALESHPVYQRLPIGLLSGSELQLNRFDSDVVSKLAVFVGTQEQDDAFGPGYELAVAAKIVEGNGIREVFESWQSTANNPRAFDDAGFESIERGGRKFLKCPSGTFLPRRELVGTARWRGRDGKMRENGINVGSMAARRYVEGHGASAAILTFALPEKLMSQSHLDISLNPRVFVTRHMPDWERYVATIYLHRPGGTLPESNKPQRDFVNVPVESFRTTVVRVPAQFSKPPQGDAKKTIRDYCVDGQVNVVLTFENRHTYLGLTPSDLVLVTPDSEYVYFKDGELLVASTIERLSEMLDASEKSNAGELARSLVLEEGQQFRIQSRPRTDLETGSWKRLLESLGVRVREELANSKYQLDGSLQLGEADIAKAEISFAGSESPSVIQTQIQKAIELNRVATIKEINEIILRWQAAGAIGDLVFSKFETKVPDKEEHEVHAARIAREIGRLYDCIQLQSGKTNPNSLSVTLRRPEALNQPEDRQSGLFWARMARVKELYNNEQYLLSVKTQDRLIRSVPFDREIWWRAAHQWGFNVCASLTSREWRDAWSRKGILLLLEGCEHVNDSYDFLWSTASALRRKADPHNQVTGIRSQFPQDQELHAELAKYIDIDTCVDITGAVDPSLAAKALFEHCLNNATEEMPLNIDEVSRYLEPASAFFEFANAMDVSGKFDPTRSVWKQVEDEWRHVMQQDAVVRYLDQQKANDQKLLGFEGATIADHNASLFYSGCTEKLELAKWQQEPWVLPIHRQTWLAEQLEEKGELESAFDSYGKAVDLMLTPLEKHAIRLPSIRGGFGTKEEGYRAMFGRLYERYRGLAWQLDREIPEKHHPFVKR